MCPDLLSTGITTNKIQDNAITLGKVQDIGDKTIIGRSAGSMGDPQQVTLTDSFYCDITNAKLWVNNYDPYRTRIEYFDDCFGALTDGNAASAFLTANVSGTGATVSNVTVTETGVFGILALETGTSTTGRSVLYSGRSALGAALSLGQGVTKIKTKIKIPTLSTSGERYKIIFGLAGDSTTATINDGIYFEYDDATSTNWRIQSANDGTRSAANTTTVVAAGSWIRLEVAANANASVVSYLINGSTVATSTTNIPTGTADPVSPILGIFKSAGSSNRTIQTDYVGFSLELTTARTT